jgi:dipeptidyl aminopeptidase/acylaminoacyl peptidase
MASKKWKVVFIVGCVAMLMGLGVKLAYASAEQSPLIPLKALLGNPERAQPRISPSGTHLAFVAPVDGVLNLWVRDLETGKEFSVTNDCHRGIQNFLWMYDNSTLLYVQDQNGDENYNIYAVDIHHKDVRALTPFQGVLVQILHYSWKHPQEMLILMNKDNKELFDLYHLDLKTGASTLLQKNPGNVVTWLTDKDLNIIGCKTSNDDASEDIWVKGETGNFDNNLIHWNMSEYMLGGIAAVSHDGKSLYACDLREANTARLVKIDIATGAKEVLCEDPRYDFSEVLVHPQTGSVLAALVDRERLAVVPIDPTFAADFKTFSAELPDVNIYIRSSSLDGTKSIIVTESDIQPPRCYLYDSDRKKLKFLFDFRPDLSRYGLAKMQPVAFRARDGLLLEGYLTLPTNTSKPVPFVLLVHGGPQVRDKWGCLGNVQWLANRGYGVLQINYRGSSGYGRAHFDAGIREWGRKMQDDLTDGVNWAVQEGIADPKRVAIFGGSYGGYAALAGAAFTPDLYAAAVDVVGPSNLITLISSIPPYWKIHKAQFYIRVGNPEVDQELLKERSPLFSSHTIKTPLLIGHGANDPRVKQAESEQIAQALKENHIPYEYVVYPDEGHGFARPENRLDFYQRAEKFLARYLGGQTE